MKRTHEYGRTLTEMLGTLVVAGILSIGAVVGYQYSMAKVKANRLYKDIKVAYITFFNQNTQPSAWQPVVFDSLSQRTFYIQRDKNNNDFVRVVGVEEGVCLRLLELAEDGHEMVLFGMDTLPLSCDVKEQDIIASFSANGVPPVILCQTGSDCPDVYNIYCDSNIKECKTCPWTQRANDGHNGCIDLCGDRTDGYTQSCGSDDTKANWCCPANYMCSDQVGMCLDDTVCMYEIETIDKISYRTNCSYNITENDVVAVQDNCPSGFYCYVNWLTETWDEGAAMTIPGADYTGMVYGVCTEMTVTGAPMQNITGGGVKEVVGCKNKSHYCRVKWIDGVLSQTIPSADYTGKAYGKCIAMTTNTVTTSGAVTGVTDFE